MAVHLNHTIVPARDKVESAEFLAHMLDLPAPQRMGHFLGVETANGVTLDYVDAGGEYPSGHYAFLLSEEEFDVVHERVTSAGIQIFADPQGQRPDEINTHDGGRGFYFPDPGGHWLEVITRPYGSGSA